MFQFWSARVAMYFLALHGPSNCTGTVVDASRRTPEIAADLRSLFAMARSASFWSEIIETTRPGRYRFRDFSRLFQ